MKLYDYYMASPLEDAPWKIYHHTTRRKLSDNYGAEIEDSPHDNMTVCYLMFKTDKRGNRYYRVTVR